MPAPLSPADQPAPAAAKPAVVEPWRAFVGWAIGELNCELRESSAGYRVVDPSAEAAALSAPVTKQSGWAVALQTVRGKKNHTNEPTGTSEAVGIDFSAETPEQLIDLLLAELSHRETLPQLAPADEPAAVNELTKHLFDAYQVDEGKVHLSGCHLELVPMVRISVRTTLGDKPAVAHYYVDAQGEPISIELASELGLANTTPVEAPAKATAIDPTVGVSILQQSSQQASEATPAATAIVLAKRVTGHLEASISDANLAIPFAGWARTLAAPPAICPLTGRETFHLTALTDLPYEGQIVAAEEVAICEASGQRMLKQDLTKCSVTGKLVAKSLCERCPVSGKLALSETFGTCPKCLERVSRAVRTQRDCAGCQSGKTLRRDDTRCETILKTVPGLANWRGWRINETATVWVVQAKTLTSQLLLVIDRQSAELRHAATKSRFGLTWKPLTAEEIAQQLNAELSSKSAS